jgi:hypothetical protein
MTPIIHKVKGPCLTSISTSPPSHSTQSKAYPSLPPGREVEPSWSQLQIVSWIWWYMPVIPPTQETVAGESQV